MLKTTKLKFKHILILNYTQLCIEIHGYFVQAELKASCKFYVKVNGKTFFLYCYLYFCAATISPYVFEMFHHNASSVSDDTSRRTFGSVHATRDMLIGVRGGDHAQPQKQQPESAGSQQQANLINNLKNPPHRSGNTPWQTWPVRQVTGWHADQATDNRREPNGDN